jgi:hypothetical protein
VHELHQRTRPGGRTDPAHGASPQSADGALGVGDGEADGERVARLVPVAFRLAVALGRGEAVPVAVGLDFRVGFFVGLGLGVGASSPHTAKVRRFSTTRRAAGRLSALIPLRTRRWYDVGRSLSSMSVSS